MIEVVINLKDLDEIEYAWIKHFCCSCYPGTNSMKANDKFYVFFDTDKIDDELFATLDENEYEYEINDSSSISRAISDIIASIDMSDLYKAMGTASSSLKELSKRMAEVTTLYEPD